MIVSRDLFARRHVVFWHNARVYIEAVKRGGVPSRPGLIHDDSRPLACAECDAIYELHYDREAEAKSTLWSILAAEIISARHPNHEQRIAIDLPTNMRETSKMQVRGPLGQAG